MVTKVCGHIINAPYEFYIHLSMLLSAINVHGYLPKELLKGTLLSIPKDKYGDMCDSDNYRGICLCSCITKLYEWLIVVRYKSNLMTSDLQFACKEGHSTTMCTAVVKDVVYYYRNRKTPVFSCFVDASKAVILNRGPHGPPGGNLQVLGGGGNTEHLGNWGGMDPFGGINK